jgi:tetratricopeptide (TPR) repeat protein
LSEALLLKYEATKNTNKDTQLLDQAERSADEACRLRPAVARFHIVRALTLLATGQHDRAIPSLEQALRLDPDPGSRPRYFDYRSTSLDQLLRLDPDAAGASERLARSYVATGQLARAEETLEQGIARRPRDWFPHVELGMFRLNQGQYKKAETHFLAGRQYAPDNPIVIGDLSVLYIMTELFDAAEQELLRGLALGPDPIFYNNLGWAYFYQEDFPKGVESLVHAVSLAPDNSVTIAGLARGYRWMGRTREARAACERAIRVGRQQISADAKNVEVRANLSYLYAEIGDRSGAAREIAHALEDAPTNVRVRFTSALVFELMGQRQAALDALKSAIDGGLPKYQITHHPDLRALRTDDRYVALVSHVAWKR